MATSGVWLKIDGEDMVAALRQALEKLNGAEGEMVLDFSSVRRLDSNALKAMETLASTMNGHVRIALRAVDVQVYKVLKLTKLAPKFSFLA
jgi:anti-anti-sigma regulatory factor